ncbi:ABC transporter ATP-binding protein [Geomicrobium sp. JCM 19055]|uniref:ABC transporter ATP-binding protein n=1 Tax=Geomicrobium sp. JCM 19055 TaxID=1460649 RepID=UPI00045EDE1A|nr:ABC transporter ATP-binding protein [Geomicrobium sp. JCM 19055]GAJ98546.1 oligopeptide transport ATP-binding protein OppD [Geomicrobium sp. JCM 19055]
MTEELLLEIKDLRTHFHTENGVVPSVDGVSFTIAKGETIALVGESGSGKSVSSLSIMGLLAESGKIESGEIQFKGKNLATANEKVMRSIRGNEIAMIFQEPLTSLNPVFTIGNQLSEMLILHKRMNKKEAKEKAIEMLERVEIPRAREIMNAYPHSLSGGMRQRVMIAMALSCDPELLIADEPTTALDVTIQAQILQMMRELTKTFNTSILFITHDLGVVAQMVDKVVVMYAGQVVEQADVHTIFKAPKHPYTKGLLDSTPKIHEEKEELHSIPGVVPNPLEMPVGCRFAPRCNQVMEICKTKEPILQATETEQIRCWLYDEREEYTYAHS